MHLQAVYSVSYEVENASAASPTTYADTAQFFNQTGECYRKELEDIAGAPPCSDSAPSLGMEVGSAKVCYCS